MFETSETRPAAEKGISGNPSLTGARIVEILRALLGMSRAIVAVFVLAHAGLAAILATGTVPEVRIILLGSLACVFGTGALIGLNDLLDIDLDRRRFVGAAGAESERGSDDISARMSEPDPGVSRGFDIGSLFIHHPVARGVISVRAGIAWVALLSVLSLAFIYQLKPSLWPIFIAIAVFVVLYSVLGMLSYWKFMAVASAVTLGAVAGWLTVANTTGAAFWLFAAWTFLWEIGGRNVPNDFNDIDEDKELGVKTIPVTLGPVAASRIVVVALVGSYLLGFPMFILAKTPTAFIAGAAAIGAYLLLVPAFALLKNPHPEVSQRLYNRSAIYPLVLLLLLMTNILVIG